MIELLGWRAVVDNNLVKRYRVKFQYDYQCSYYLRSINKGEFSSNIPFTLEQDGENINLVTTNAELVHSCGSWRFTIINEIESDKEFINMDTYVLTHIYIILFSNGFELSSNRRKIKTKYSDFVGDFSNPTPLLTEELFHQKLTLNFVPAEFFECHKLSSNEYYILYDPRYGTYEKEYNLTSSSFQNVKIKETFPNLIRSRSHTKERFQRITSLIIDYKMFNQISITPINQISFNILPSPILNIQDTTLSDLSLNALEKAMKNSIQINSVFQKYNVFIDNTNNVNQGLIEEFLLFFQNQTGQTPEIIFDSITDLKFQESRNALIAIIDDTIPGASYVYKKIKQTISNISKVILVTSVQDRNSWENIIKVSWIHLRFRSNNMLLQNIDPHINDTSHSIISLSKRSLMGGKWIRIVGVMIADENVISNKVEYQRTNLSFNVININELQKLLKSLIGDKIVHPLMITTDDQEIYEIVSDSSKSIENICCICHIRQSKCILMDSASIKNVPKDGTVVKLTHQKSLVMTNGPPNNDFDGLPSPLSIELKSAKHDIIEVSREIFYNTFIHPFSFRKPKLPFTLHFARQLLYDRRN